LRVYKHPNIAPRGAMRISLSLSLPLPLYLERERETEREREVLEHEIRIISRRWRGL